MSKYIKKILIVSIVLLIIIITIDSYIYLILQPSIEAKLQTMPLSVRQQLTQHHAIYVSLNKISKYVPLAAIASQDERFYTNPGVDLEGTLRAIFYTLTNQQRQGASTITEQLAKNVYFNDQDNLQTDILTKLYALFITEKFTKQQILEMYLNEIYFGKLAYGINAAAQTYFSTSASNLSLVQSAYLLGLINAPSYFAIHKAQAKSEAALVLKEMRSENYISTTQLDRNEASLHNIKTY